VIVPRQALGHFDAAASIPASIGGNFQARSEPELSQDAAHITPHSVGANLQPVPDLLIAQTLANQSDDLSLTPSDLRRVSQMAAAGKGVASTRSALAARLLRRPQMWRLSCLRESARRTKTELMPQWSRPGD